MNLKKFIAFFIPHLEGLRKSQRKTLAVLVFGLMQSKRVGVAAIARGIPGKGNIKHRIKRVDRFLGNERVPVKQGVRPLLLWVALPRKTLFVALDWTDLHDGKHHLLCASVLCDRRAIPILWRVTAKENPQVSQNREEEMFLEELREILPRDREIVLLADRGFGRVSLLEKLESLGFSYILRVPAHAFVQGEHFTGRLLDFPLRFGYLDLGTVLYQKKAQHPFRLIFALTPFQEEPWFLATNLSWEVQRILKGYQRRMDIEEGFRDFKNHRTGFGLKDLVLSTPARYERLFLILAYAYFFLLLSGAYGERMGLHRKLSAQSATGQRVLGLHVVGYYTIRFLRPSYRKLLSLLSSLLPEV